MECRVNRCVIYQLYLVLKLLSSLHVLHLYSRSRKFTLCVKSSSLLLLLRSSSIQLTTHAVLSFLYSNSLGS